MNVYDQTTRNRRNAWLLFLGFFAVMYVLGWVISAYYGMGDFGIILILALALVYSMISYYLGSLMILGVNGAKEAKKEEYPYLYNTVEGLSIAAGLPMPKVYVMDDPSPNAFATGRDPAHSSVAVTTGLLGRLNRLELEGVIAHELSHIKNYDIRFTMLVIAMVGAIGLLAGFASRMFWHGGGRRDKNSGAIMIIAVVVAILAPLFAHLVKLAISRKREYMADATGALLTRYPKGLADALKKIAQAEPMKSADQTSAPLYISNPFGRNAISGLFSTHPPIEDRIKRLESM
ncbi:MAG: zinc metalloprotease HtpX [Candidatus Altiarchaeales archaeon IMC4]|nr:MAG: zinc metalloprotease HtpX [Candidatus Altiarchaeales archaeon IMC4]